MRIAFLLTTLLLVACGDKESGPQPTTMPRGKPVIYTTFYPTTYFTERIVGDAAEVVCPLPEGEDPIFWDPDENAIRGYQEADLIIINGASFEKWVDKVSLPMARQVDTAQGFANRFVRFEESTTHSHGKTGEHSHEGIDGHTWLDPLLASAQAEAIRVALVRLLPDNEAELKARCDTLSSELATLDAAFRGLGDLPAGMSLYASHPAYNYLAKCYGWRVVNLDLDPEQMPSGEVFAAVKASLTEKPGRHLLWESEPLPAIAERFRTELGLESILFSPCEGPPQGGDYLSVMRANSERVAAAFE